MRKAARIDANQSAIVTQLRQAGATVQMLTVMGGGVPDLLVGYRSVNHLIEVKNPLKSPSGRSLTPDQVTWHDLWRGSVSVVETPQQALAVIGCHIE